MLMGQTRTRMEATVPGRNWYCVATKTGRTMKEFLDDYLVKSRGCILLGSYIEKSSFFTLLLPGVVGNGNDL